MQQTIFDTEAQIRRDDGIKRAVKHANATNEHWIDIAYEYAEKYVLKTWGPLLIEEIRMASENDGVPLAPSKRAWGGIARRLVKRGIIRHCGYGKTTNPKAHCANAAQWIRI